jgi:hypothetical protein
LAEDQNNRLPELADDLVRRKVAVIVAGASGAMLAKAAELGQRYWQPQLRRTSNL